MVSRAAAENRVVMGFWIHLFVYLAVIAALAALNITRNPNHLWFLWVAVGWGTGVAAHAASLFTWPARRERMINRAVDRMNRRASAT